MPGPTYALWPGVTKARGFDFTFSPGVTPSVCTIYTVPHTETIAQDGTLVLRTEGETPILFRNCKLEAPQLDAGQNGAYWRLPILDRRWKWQFAFAYGSFNIPKPDGTYLREKTPQEIAALLFNQMGDANADVSRLPNLTRPECKWEDGAEAAAELDKLCASLGCIVVLNHITDRAEVWPIGQAAEGQAELPTTYPASPISGKTFAPVKLAAPQKIQAVSAPTLFQDTFTTEAVGLDTDGRWKPINQLSYTPPSGTWERLWPAIGFPVFDDSKIYTQHGTQLKIRDLAEGTVYRCYRITGTKTSPFGAGFTIKTLDGLLTGPQNIRDFRLYDELAEEEISTVDGGLRRLPARVFAQRWREGRRNMTKPERYPYGFNFDTTHGIVTFNEPVFQALQGKILPAVVHIETSFNVSHHNVGVMHRLEREIDGGGAVTTPVRAVPTNIFARSMVRYADNGTSTVEHNWDTARSKLIAKATDAKKEYADQNGGTINYKKLMRTIQLDGKTIQITWSGGGGREPTTTVSQAQRHNRVVKQLDEYRERLAAKQSERLIHQLLVQETLRGAFI